MLTFAGRIPIRIHSFFWLLPGMIGWINSQDLLGTLLWIAIILVSVLIHEYGHACTALFFGQEAEIDLIMLGGMTNRKGPKLKLWQEFLVVLNGPLAGFALGFIAYFIAYKINVDHQPLLYSILGITWFVNIFWTILNLLPVHPLDGGKLLNILLEALFGLRGVKIGYFFSIGLALLLALFFFYNHSLFVGSLFLIFAFENYRAWQASLQFTVYDRDQELQKTLEQAELDIQNGHYTEAMDSLKQIENTAKSGYIRTAALQYQASILNSQNHFEEAYGILKDLKGKLTYEGQKLLQSVCYHLHKWREATELGNIAYQSQPDVDIALLNAICHANLAEAKPCVGWLQCALKDGASKDVFKIKEFDAIRQDPLFQSFSNSQ